MKIFQISLILLQAIMFALVASGNSLFEPSVTTEESEALERTAEIAGTNVNAALEFLAGHDIKQPGPAIDYALGNLYFQAEDYAKAVDAYERALKKLPEFRRAMANLGRVYLITERTPEAVKLYQNLVKNGRADAEILLLLGHALMITEKPLSAETAYRHALLLEPVNRRVKTGLAKSLIAQERFKEALALLRELASDDPENGGLFALMADCHIAEGNYDKALVSLECARRLGYVSGEILATLGDIYIYREQPRDALEAYASAAQSGKLSLERTLRAARGMLALEQTEKAAGFVDVANEIMRAGPEPARDIRSSVMLVESEIEKRRGNIEVATAISKKILESDPLNGAALIMRGKLSEQLGMHDEAVLQYERAARVPETRQEALFRHAQLETGRGNYAKAVKLLETAQETERDQRVARYLERLRALAESASDTL